MRILILKHLKKKLSYDEKYKPLYYKVILTVSAN